MNYKKLNYLSTMGMTHIADIYHIKSITKYAVLNLLAFNMLKNKDCGQFYRYRYAPEFEDHFHRISRNGIESATIKDLKLAKYIYSRGGKL